MKIEFKLCTLTKCNLFINVCVGVYSGAGGQEKYMKSFLVIFQYCKIKIFFYLLRSFKTVNILLYFHTC